MRAVRYHEHGGPEVLRVDDVAVPDPADDEVRVRVHAAGVNPVDTYFREGSYSPPALPMIPGSDLAGVVDAVGDDVEAFAPGDRVFGTGLGSDRQGTFAEYAVAPADLLAPLPAGIDFAEGAAVALVGATAWRALVVHAGLEPAETCLVHGGSGGVGHVAVQLAAATGARVLATARPDYHDRVAGLGADVVLDYGRSDLADAVVDAGRPSVVLDHRLDDYLGLDAEVAARGCRIVGIGNQAAVAEFPDVSAARGRELECHLMSVYNTPDVGAVLRRVAELLRSGDVVPEVSDGYPLEETAAAQRDVLERSFVGKLVVDVGPQS